MARLEAAGLSWENRNLNRFLSGLNQANRGMRDVGSSAGNVGPQFSALTGVITGVSMAITTKLINAFQRLSGATVGTIKDSVALAATFESMETGLKIAAGAAATEAADAVGGLGEVALAVGGDTRLLGVSATGAADAMTGLLKQGLSLQEVMGDTNAYMNEGAQLGGALRAAIDLAAASELDMVQASDLAAISLSTFGGDLETTEERSTFVNEAMNNFVKAADGSVASVSELMQAQSNIGPIANAFGMSLEETNQALAVLSSSGIRGAEAGTALKSMMTNIMRATPKVQDALDEVGISLYDQEGQMYSLVEIIGQFQIATQDMSEAQRNQFIQTVAGTYGMKSLNTFLAKGVEGWYEMGEQIENATGIQAQAEARAATFAGQMEALEGNLETVRIRIGKAFLPVLTQLTSKFSEIVERYGPAIAGVFQRIGEAASSLVSALLEGDLSSFEQLNLDPGWADTFVVIKDSIKELFAVIFGTPTDAFDDRFTLSPEVSETTSTIRRITDAIKTFLDTIFGTKASIDDQFQLSPKAADSTRSTFDRIIEAVASAKQAISDTIASITGFINDTFLPAWQAVWPKVESAVAAVLPVVTTLLSSMFSWLSESGPEVISGVVSAITTFFTDEFLPLWNQIWPQVSAAVATAVPVITDLISKAFEWLQNNGPLVKEIVKGIAIAFVAFKAAAVIVPIIQNIVGAIALVQAGLASAGFIIQGVILVLGGPLTIALAAIIALVTGLALAWKTNLFGIRDTVQRAMPKVLEIFEGVKSTISTVIGVITDVLGGPLLDAFATIRTAVADNIGPATERFRQLWESLTSLFNDVVLPVLKAIGTVIVTNLVAALGVVLAVIRGVIQGISAALPHVIDIVTGIVGVIAGVVNVVAGLLQGIYGILTGNVELQREAWEKLKKGVVGIITGLMDVIPGLFWGAFRLIEGFVKGFVSGIIDFFKSLYNRLVGRSIVTDLVDGVIEGFETLVKTVKATVKGWVDDVASFFTDLKDRVLGTAQAWLENLQATIRANLNMLHTLWRAAWDRVKEITAEIIASIRQRIITWADGIKQTIQNWRETIATYFSNLWNAIKDTISDVVNHITEGFEEFTEDAEKMVKKWVKAVVKFFENLWKDIKNTVTDIKNTVTETFTTTLETVETKVTNWIENIKSFLRGLRDRVIEIVGEMLTSLLSTIQTKLEEVKTFWSTKWGEMRDFIPGLFKQVATKVKEGIGGIPEAISSVWETIKGIGKTIIEKIKEGFSLKWFLFPAYVGLKVGQILQDLIDAGAFQKIVEVGDKIVDAIKEGISNAWGSFVAWLMERVAGIFGHSEPTNPKSPFRKQKLESSGDWIGSTIMESIQKGMASSLPSMRRELQSMAPSLQMAATPVPSLPQSTSIDRSRHTNVEVNPTYEQVQSPASVYYDVEAALASIISS